MDKTVIVIGTSRSGTSMTAAVLHAIGVDMNPIMEASELTPNGIFEDEVITHLTVKICQDLKSGLSIGKARRKYREEIESMMRSGLWGFKSAQTLHCIDVLFPFIVNPYFVYVTRDAEDNARGKIHHRKVQENTVVTYEQALQEVIYDQSLIADLHDRFSESPSVDVTFNYVQTHPDEAAKKLSEFLEIPLTNEMVEAAKSLIIRNYSSWKNKKKETVMIENAIVKDPASTGHEYQLLTLAGKVGASKVIRLKNEHTLKTSTAHTTLRKLSRDYHGQTVMIEIDMLDKDPEWWAEKLHNCGFVMSTTSTALVREATKWTDVWVCLCS